MPPRGGATTSTCLHTRGPRGWRSHLRRRTRTRCTARTSPKRTTPRPRIRSSHWWPRPLETAASSTGSTAGCASTNEASTSSWPAPGAARPPISRRSPKHPTISLSSRQNRAAAMAKKTLNIVESAYRAVMEEQDDTILWLLAAMRGAGAEHTVVLRGNAVNYAVAGQGAPGLTIGGWKQTQAPRMDNDVLDLIEKRKIPVFVIEEDLAVRGIEPGELVAGVELMSSAMLPKRMAEYAIVSHW